MILAQSARKHAAYVLIVALGVSDLVVVHSADATLVCHRDHVQAIRDLATAREQRFGERYE